MPSSDLQPWDGALFSDDAGLTVKPVAQGVLRRLVHALLAPHLNEVMFVRERGAALPLPCGTGFKDSALYRSICRRYPGVAMPRPFSVPISYLCEADS